MSDLMLTVTSSKSFEFEHPELKNKIIKFLINNNIIENNLTDCILNTRDKGYPPGKNIKEIFKNPKKRRSTTFKKASN